MLDSAISCFLFDEEENTRAAAVQLPLPFAPYQKW
jgi:hypothetical protein